MLLDRVRQKDRRGARLLLNETALPEADFSVLFADANDGLAPKNSRERARDWIIQRAMRPEKRKHP